MQARGALMTRHDTKRLPAAATGVVRVDEAHLELLTELIRLAWSPAASVEHVRQARRAAAAVNPHGQGEEVPTFLFMADGRALGHLTTIPVVLWADGREHRAYWFKGFWVRPEHRNGLVGFLLLKEAMRHLEASLSMVVQPAPRRLFAAFGLRDLGVIPNYVRLLNPAGVLQRLDRSGHGIVPAWLARLASQRLCAKAAGAAAGLALKAWTLPQPSARRAALEPVAGLDPDAVDRLWRHNRDRLLLAPSSDHAHLRARYIGKRDIYQAVTLQDPRLGFAILRRPRQTGDRRLGNVRLATLADLFYPLDQPRLGLRLLAAAEQMARELGADALLCSSSHRALRPLLRRRGYVPLGGNVHFMARGDGIAAIDLADCWLLRGDGEADDAL